MVESQYHVEFDGCGMVLIFNKYLFLLDKEHFLWRFFLHGIKIEWR